MSRYYVNKFLYQVDRNPDYLKRYAEDPKNFVATWEQSIGPRLNEVELSTVHSLTEAERRALVEHDFVALFEMGAHFFLNLTLFIGIYDEPYMKENGPLAFQREFARKVGHWTGKDYPSVES
ncbi:MAG: hypothetical protein KJ944_18015 [Alphaproteobacteria bacterium]|jgi:hypothetical protein|nr:hypothetical protein [Alphaproteobacteria bacterium]MBU1561916.1 hypothetical protein [Alphaproteobacteria bacterium]MBU2304486.1 hypothetical protein [Alphaproteobacteria bacterium]MBU2367827.1 hypothetical protein [Alphaproteobacteria bacterium]